MFSRCVPVLFVCACAGGSSSLTQGSKSSETSSSTSSPTVETTHTETDTDPGTDTDTDSTGGTAPTTDTSTTPTTTTPAPQAAVFVVTLDQTAPLMDLADALDLTVTVSPNGYVGDVALALTGLPTDVTGSLASPSVTLDGATPVDVTLSLTTASDTVTGALLFTVTGTVETGAPSATGTLTVQPALTVVIPANFASYASYPPNTTAYGAYPTVIQALPYQSDTNPVSIYFYNADSVPHEIHASYDDQGFGHSGGEIQPYTLDATVRNVNSAGTYDYYDHDLGGSILGEIVIQ